ncbi:preQ(1) synthase, partial [Staphylococcus epidermidis]|uniref:preQ(1) synthase n=1 Tax=Staphylococcus epidermidis TaxID=1282 RepID=UPI00119E37FE
KHQPRHYFVNFNSPQFTSLSPITPQPHFPTIYISYIPNIKILQSKSLNLYLFTFTNHADFHQHSINIIINHLINLIHPHYIQLSPKFTPTPPISIHPYTNYRPP